MSNIVDFPKGPYVAEFHGPFVEHRVTLGGYRVPHLTAQFYGDLVSLIVDHRFGSEAVPADEAQRWVPIIAHAMAVAAGYSSHGENCQIANPFKVQVRGIEISPSGDAG